MKQESLTSNAVSKEMRDCFQGNIDRYSGQTHYVDCWRDHWACALARTLDEIDRLTYALSLANSTAEAAQGRAEVERGAKLCANCEDERRPHESPQPQEAIVDAGGLPERVWVVIGEGAQPEYTAGWPEACHEHINDALEQDIKEAARWIVREYVLPSAPNEPKPAYLPEEDHYENCAVYEGSQRGFCSCRQIHEQSSPVEPLPHQPISTAKEMTMETVDSTSDQRTVNNVMRHAYRVLSDAEKAQMQAIKDKGLEFWELIDSIGASRELSLAKTASEEAVMWAVKHITK